MEQKSVRVPFDLELAKKITDKEIESRIVTRDGRNARILCFDANGRFPIVALIDGEDGEMPVSYTSNGLYQINETPKLGCDLLLEIPEYMTFKDGDVIYCEVDNGGGDYCKWISILDGTVGTILSLNFHAYVTLITDASKDAGAVLFDDNSDNIGLIRLATEQEKQKLIDALKASKEPTAKEYLKRFFGIEEKKECEFKPFDKVLVRDEEFEDGVWCIDIFSHVNKKGDFVCVGSIWGQCIPYNEQTAHLLGTTDDWEG